MKIALYNVIISLLGYILIYIGIDHMIRTESLHLHTHITICYTVMRSSEYKSVRNCSLKVARKIYRDDLKSILKCQLSPWMLVLYDEYVNHCQINRKKKYHLGASHICVNEILFSKQLFQEFFNVICLISIKHNELLWSKVEMKYKH